MFQLWFFFCSKERQNEVWYLLCFKSDGNRLNYMYELRLFLNVFFPIHLKYLIVTGAVVPETYSQPTFWKHEWRWILYMNLNFSLHNINASSTLWARCASGKIDKKVCWLPIKVGGSEFSFKLTWSTNVFLLCLKTFTKKDVYWKRGTGQFSCPLRHFDKMMRKLEMKTKLQKFQNQQSDKIGRSDTDNRDDENDYVRLSPTTCQFTEYASKPFKTPSRLARTFSMVF